MSSTPSSRPSHGPAAVDLDYTIEEFEPGLHRDSTFLYRRTVLERIAYRLPAAVGMIISVWRPRAKGSVDRPLTAVTLSKAKGLYEADSSLRSE